MTPERPNYGDRARFPSHPIPQAGIEVTFPPVESVTVQFYKNPDVLHWGFQGSLLGADQYGRWVALPRGSRRWKGDVEWHPTGEDAVQCFPHDSWWVLHYNGPVRRVSHFIDIATLPEWRDGWVEMIDLDLDIVVVGESLVEIEDEAEFEVNQILYGYTPEMIERARAETDRVSDLVRRRQEPFFDAARAWLERV